MKEGIWGAIHLASDPVITPNSQHTDVRPHFSFGSVLPMENLRLPAYRRRSNMPILIDRTVAHKGVSFSLRLYDEVAVRVFHSFVYFSKYFGGNLAIGTGTLLGDKRGYQDELMGGARTTRQYVGYACGLTVHCVQGARLLVRGVPR